MRPNFSKRRRKLRNLMAKKGMDAILTPNHNDVFYYTGYKGLKEDTIFMIFPLREEPRVVVTTLENEADLKYKNVVFIDRIRDFLDQLKPYRRIGYDEGTLKVILYKELEKLKAKLKPAGKMLEIPRMVKEPYEIEQLRKAIRVTKKVFGKIGNPEGRKESEISNEIDILFRKHGVENAFESIVSSGKQTAFIHHDPNERVVRKGDHVLIDIGCRVNMYCSDLARIFFRGLGKKQKAVYEDVKEIHNSIIDSIEAGKTYKEVEKVQEMLFKRKGYEVFHNFGHGVGLSVHDPVSNILNKNEVLTVEPGIYLKNVGGFRIEDMVLVRKGKAEVLSKSLTVF